MELVKKVIAIHLDHTYMCYMCVYVSGGTPVTVVGLDLNSSSVPILLITQVLIYPGPQGYIRNITTYTSVRRTLRL